MLYVFLLLFSVYLLVKELKGNPWYAILAVLFIYNFNASFGFVGFIIAIPTTLLVFYLAICDNRRPNFKYTIGASVLLVILYLMHAQVALFAMLLYGAALLYGYWRRWGLLLLKGVLVILPVMIMVMIWWNHRTAELQEQSTLSYLAFYYKNHYFQEFFLRFKIFIYDHQALRESKLLPLLLNIAVLFPLIYFKAWKGFSQKWMKQDQVIYPLLLFVACFASYMFLPNYLPGQGPVHERQVTFVFLSLIILGSVLLKDVNLKFLRPYALALCLVYSALWSEHLYTFNKQNRDLTPEFFAGLPSEKNWRDLFIILITGGITFMFTFPITAWFGTKDLLPLK